MTEETSKAETISSENIKSPAHLKEVINRANNDRLNWAQARIAEIGYPQAVHTELALYRTDFAVFAVNALCDLLEKQEARIAELERSTVKALNVRFD